MENGLINAQDVATLMGVRLRTVRSWTERGLVPCIRLGPRLVRYRREEIEELVRLCADPAPTPLHKTKRGGKQSEAIAR